MYQNEGRSHSHRTRITNLLWKERFAKGSVEDQNGNNQRSFAQNLDQEFIKKKVQEYKPIKKTMEDSYCEIILPFRQDLHLREEYINFFKALRLGKILEDLDALAATIALRHCLPEAESDIENCNLMNLADLVPFNVVTASLDRLDLLNILRPDLDLKCYGCVTYAGKSSMEVTVRVASFGDPNQLKDKEIDQSGLPLPDNGEHTWTPLLLCKFTLVAKDPFTNKAASQVNYLVSQNSIEEQLMELGNLRKQRRLESMKSDLISGNAAPTSEESQLIHELWLERRSIGHIDSKLGKDELNSQNIALMSQTRQSDIRICFPQERNIHGSVFGGFLMREAFELAYATATLYIKARPLTVAMDEVAFRKPVPVGSILRLNSEVSYAEGEPHRTFQVSVVAEVLRHEKEYQSEITNTFHFTFARCDTEQNQQASGDLLGTGVGRVRRILPVTYEESMKWILGKRRKQKGILEKQSQLDEFKMKFID